MDPAERAAVAAIMARGDPAEINRTLERLATEDEESVRLAVSMLGVSGPDHWELQTLLKDRPDAIQALIEMVDQEPFTERGNDAGYLLGNIGYAQGPNRDARIPTTLILALDRSLPKPPTRIDGLVFGLQEAVLLHPVPEATRVAERMLDAFEQGTEAQHLSAVRPTFLILWHADRTQAEAAVAQRLGRLPSSHWLHPSLTELLAAESLASG